MAINQSLSLTQVSQSIADNTSQVRILWKSVQSGGSYNETEKTAWYYVSVNGGQEQGYSLTYTLPYQSETTLLDTEITVPHNADGTGTVTVRTYMQTGISAGTVENSQTLTLTDIPRVSTLSVNAAAIGSRAAIAITKQSSAFSHCLSFVFGGLSGYVTKDGGISEQVQIFSTEKVDFLLPESFYTQIPNSSSGIGTLTLQTFSQGVCIGQSTAELTVLTEESLCGPVVSGTVCDVNERTDYLTQSDQFLVRYVSDALCTLSASPRQGASIVEKRINGVTVTDDTRLITAVEDYRFTFYARDSRGYETTVTVENPLIYYVPVTNNATVARLDPTGGEAVLTLQGSFFQAHFGKAANALTLQYRIDGGSWVSAEPALADLQYYASVYLTGMDYDKSYTVEVQASDLIGIATKVLTLGTGIPVFDWGQGDFAFHVPVSMDSPLGLSSGGTGKNLSGETDGILVKSGQAVSTTQVKMGALYAPQPGAAAAFGTLPIACGGTGGTTAEIARDNLQAAPQFYTAGSFVADSLEEINISQIYDRIPDWGCQNTAVVVHGVVYRAHIWRQDENNGTLELFRGREHLLRLLQDGVWQSWEYCNPPMALGTEYRTAKRFAGKAVYTKLVDCGALPNSSVKTVAHGAAATQILMAWGQASNGQTFPVGSNQFYTIALRAGKQNIEIYTDYNYSAYTATVQLWYTKE